MLTRTQPQPQPQPNTTGTPTTVRPAVWPSTGRDPLSETLEMMGAAMAYGRNEEIYGEDEPAEFLYLVRTGAVRTYKLLNDGRRQIGGFHMLGDVFGLEVGEQHRFTAEAIADSTVVVVKRSALVALAAHKVELARQLWTLTARELAHVQELMLTLGRKTAQERVAAFLLEMEGRGAPGAAIELPMSRQDIADYLGLTIETVSRTLTQLENAAAIALQSSRRIVLRNRAALSRLNG
jgi:CRP/FNR family nitrogen fixation transcriptional regulator